MKKQGIAPCFFFYPYVSAPTWIEYVEAGLCPRPKPPLCKGRCPTAQMFDGGIVCANSYSRAPRFHTLFVPFDAKNCPNHGKSVNL